nr:MAG TPA: hypothetical protein [Caudoviricetes sp.]
MKSIKRNSADNHNQQNNDNNQFFALIHSVTLNFGQKYNNLCRLLEKYYGNFSLIRNIIVTLRCF